MRPLSAGCNNPWADCAKPGQQLQAEWDAALVNELLVPMIDQHRCVDIQTNWCFSVKFNRAWGRCCWGFCYGMDGQTFTLNGELSPCFVQDEYWKGSSVQDQCAHPCPVNDLQT